MGCDIHPWGIHHWVLHSYNPLEFTHGRHMCNLVMVMVPLQVCTVNVPSTTLSWGKPSATQSAVPQPSHLYGGAYSFGGLADSHLIPLPSLHSGEGSSFLGLVPSGDTVDSESVMGIKPGDSGVVIRYQVDDPGEGLWLIPTFILGSQVWCYH